MIELFNIIAAVTNISLGILVLRKQPYRKEAQLYFILTFIGTIWIITNLLWWVTLRYEWLQLTYTTGLLFGLMGIVWVHAVSVIPFPRYYILVYLNFVILLILSLIDNALLLKFAPGEVAGYHEVRKGIFFDFYSFFMFYMMLLILYRLYQGYKKARGLQRQQRQIILLGAALFLAFIIIIDFIIPSFFNRFTLTYLDSPISIIWTGLAAYVTLRYQFMQVNVLVRRGFVYLFLAVFSYLFFYLIVWIFIKIFGNLWSPPALAAGFVLSVLFAIVLPKLERAAIYVSNKYLYANIYDARKTFEHLMKSMAAIITLDRLAGVILTAIRSTLRVHAFALVAFNASVHVPQKVGFSRDDMREIERTAPKLRNMLTLVCAEDLKINLKRFKKTMNQSELLMRLFKKANVEIIIPLVRHQKSIGFILLGKKPAGHPYTQNDIELLNQLAKQGTLAIDNALLYHDMLEKNKHLKNMLKTHAEFLDITSHQLRTPISILRSAANLLERRRKLIDYKEGLGIIYEATIRLNGIVDDMLLASKLDAREFRLTPSMLETLSLKQIVEDVLKTLRVRIKKYGIDVHTDLSDALILGYGPFLSVVVENLIDNAIKYTYNSNPGALWITIEQKGERVVFQIKDNGIGIARKDRKKVFEKFTRTKEAMKNVPQGTGLGLFIVQKVISAHPTGRYGLESEPGRGSTFWFELPAGK